MAPVMAQVLADRGDTALVFRGDDGLDELTMTTTSSVWVAADGAVTARLLDPAHFDIEAVAPEALRGGDPAHNAAVVHDVLAGGGGPVRDAVLLNAAAGIAAYDGCAPTPCTPRSPPACGRRPARSTAGPRRPCWPGGSRSAVGCAHQREGPPPAVAHWTRAPQPHHTRPGAGLGGLGGRGGGPPRPRVAVAARLSEANGMPGHHHAATALSRAGGSPDSPLLGARLVTAWQLDAVWLAVVVCLAAAYLTGVALVRVRTPDRSWPLVRTTAFFAGLAVIV